MSTLFSTTEAADLRSRELPQPTFRASMRDLDGAVLFGAGRFSRALIPAMRKQGYAPAWIVDNNPQLWGQELEGIRIQPATSLSEVGERLVLIMTTYLRQMAEACRSAQVRNWTWFTDIKEVFGDVSIAVSAEQVLSEPEIDRLCTVLDQSAESLETLKCALRCRVTGDQKDVPVCAPGWYFPDDLIPSHDYSHFVDCGAFDGDTLTEWIDKRGAQYDPAQVRYHAFEPDPANFALLKDSVSGLPAALKKNIMLHLAAVGDCSGTIGMVQGGDGTELYKDATDGPLTAVVRLDEALAGETVGVIKMDVEGYEPLALEGARAILENQRPALLVSIYHRPEHLWKIPLWIHDLGLGYKIVLRHHSMTSSETLCYAVPRT